MKKGLVAYARPDSSTDTAGRYFRILARRFKRAHPHADIRLESFGDNAHTEFLADLSKPDYTNLDVFAYIGHGSHDQLLSADWGDRNITPNDVASKLRTACNDGAAIIFYACNVGKLNNSFLSTLQLLTFDKRFRLYGHSTSGRAGNNPQKTAFLPINGAGPPSGGGMLIDICLGDLAKAPRFRRAWDAAIGDETDGLWATFFTLTHLELLFRSCRPVIRRAARTNNSYQRSLGWGARRSEIFELVKPAEYKGFVGPLEKYDELLAVGIARWQYRKFGPTNSVDGILGRTSWPHMQAEL